MGRRHTRSRTRSRTLVQAALTGWAWLTRCRCRDLDYLDHRTRSLHYRNSKHTTEENA